MALTDEKCKNNDNIPISEIKQDIADTQIEIEQYESEWTILIKDRRENRLDIYMREGKVANRKEFISNLTSILEYRK